MADNLPAVHSGVPDDCLKAENSREAIIVKEWGDGKAVAQGDESKQEWIVAPACYGLDWMR